MAVVMVVDDQAVVRELVQAALRNEGFETITAADGAEAIELVEEARPDLIILDLAMPRMDGLAALRRIRSMPLVAKTPVLILTGQTDRELLIQATRQGISGCILKPMFSVDAMLEKVKQITAKQLPAAAAVATRATPLSGTSNTTVDSKRPPLASLETERHRTMDGEPAPHLLTPQEQVQRFKDLKPVITRGELTDRIDACCELKGFSPAVSEVLKLTGNSRCSIEHIARAISRDHAIALKILKLANSAVYTRGEPVDSVLKAVLRIGVGQIRQTVLNLAVIDRFSDQMLGGCIESGQFWEHAMATGIIAAEIAHTRGDREADAAFTVGLLHDVGRIVYATTLQDHFGAVVETARDIQLPLEALEQRMLCINHAEIMDRVFRSWKFSKHLINPIVFHHASVSAMRNAVSREITEVATLALANRLAHAFMLGSSGNDVITPTEELCDVLRLESAVVQRIEQTARDETDKVKFALLSGSNQANWQQLNVVYRESLPEPLRPLYVSLRPQFDACRIFCDQLREPGDECEVHNIGIVHITSPRERVDVINRYLASEPDAKMLPLIVLLPMGHSFNEPRLLDGRRVQFVHTPFAIERFLASVRNLLACEEKTAEPQAISA